MGSCIKFKFFAWPCPLWHWRRQWHPSPVLLPGKSHGRRSLDGVTRSWTRLSDFTFPFHFHALEKEMATHSSVLAWRIPGTGELGGLPSMGLHRVGHDGSDLAAAAAVPFGMTTFCILTRERRPDSWLHPPLNLALPAGSAPTLFLHRPRKVSRAPSHGEAPLLTTRQPWAYPFSPLLPCKRPILFLAHAACAQGPIALCVLFFSL